MHTEQPDLTLVTALKAQYRRMRLLALVYLAAAILALVFFFVDKRITLVLVVASLIYHLAAVRPAGKRYQTAFVHACAQYTLERRLEGARHRAEPVLQEEEVLAVRMIAVNAAKGSLILREGGSGRWHGRAVALGDAGFTHTFPMEGKRHHEFVVGTWVTVDLGRDTGLDWRLIHEDVMMKPSWQEMFRDQPGLMRAVRSLPDWIGEGPWLVIRGEAAPGLPPAPFLSAVRKLAAGTQKPLALCVRGDKLHVFVTNRILGQKVSSRVEPTEAVAQVDLLPELDGILHLSDLLAQ